MSNLREDFINASRLHFKAGIEKHRGIGEHGDVMEEIEKELEKMADYADKLEMLDYFEAEIGPNKTVLKG